jgi:hypothetical protein
MSDAKPDIPDEGNESDVGEFWDSHDLADYWDQTEPAEFEMAPSARRRYLVALDATVLKRVHQVAHQRGISTESLVNLLLEQRLSDVEATG